MANGNGDGSRLMVGVLVVALGGGVAGTGGSAWWHRDHSHPEVAKLRSNFYQETATLRREMGDMKIEFARMQEVSAYWLSRVLELQRDLRQLRGEAPAKKKERS